MLYQPEGGKGYDNFLISYIICGYQVQREKEAEKKSYRTLCLYVYIYVFYLDQHPFPRTLDKYKWQALLFHKLWLTHSHKYSLNQTRQSPIKVLIHICLSLLCEVVKASLPLQKPEDTTFKRQVVLSHRQNVRLITFLYFFISLQLVYINYLEFNQLTIQRLINSRLVLSSGSMFCQ